MSVINKALLAHRGIVRLYGLRQLSVPLCDPCATLADFDRNASPIIPLIACSACGKRNMVSTIPEGWTLPKEDPGEAPSE